MDFGSQNAAYQALPLSYETKASHRRALVWLLPKVLALSGNPRPPTPSLVVPRLPPLNGSGFDISLSTSTNPTVSVVIPIYGQIEYTLQCLASIAANPPSAPFEVIVVDDCSPDDPTMVLERVRGIRLVRNAENQGFIRSCNAGANIARGKYLHFLNNDTVVTFGWLDELLRTFDEFPGTGFVGSKLIYPDGRLQEAGGIIWRDGSPWNFGRDQDAALPVYNYAREVDYCSGASIMLPKALFIELGGFDELYLPAYCEDADLALKVRDKGYRVLYQPLSTVVHFEGITSGTDTTSGVKSYQVENTKRLFERWQDRFKSHESRADGPDQAKDRTAKRRVLVLDHCTPTPDQDAGSVVLFNMLLLLREMDFQVTLFAEDCFYCLPQYTSSLQRVGVEVLYPPDVVSAQSHMKKEGGRYDLVLLCRPTIVEQNIKAVRRYCGKAKVLFHAVDLHFLRMRREAELLNDNTKLNDSERMRQRELRAIHSVDATIVLSTAELELLQHELPDRKIHLLPLVMQVRGTDAHFDDRRDVIFIGGYRHPPNLDAAQFFVSEVMPLLREQLPGVRFHAAGSNPPPALQQLASEDVVVTGFVEDLDQLLDTMRVSVAPLRFGAGVKGKIGTAMTVGLPVVATSLAIEGMDLTDEKNVLVADGAEALANDIVRLYRDETLWNALSREGLAFADHAWGAESGWKNLSAVLADLGFESRRNGRELRLYAYAADPASSHAAA